MKVVRKIMLVINIAVSILLLAICFSFKISPEKSMLLAFIPFAYIALLALNVIFIVIWLIFKWQFLLISAIPIVVGFKFLNLVVPFTSYVNLSTQEPDFKIMTYNVMAFGLYNWDKEENIKYNILNVVKEENPDIICFQEAYWNSSNKNFITVDSAKYILNADYVYKGVMASGIGGQNFGLATVSRYPIVNTYSYKFENSSNGYVYTDLLIKGDTVRVYNCHLQSIHLDSDDFSAIKEMFEKELNSEVKGVVKKYVKAYSIRAKQAEMLKESIASCRYPVFVCGDFNDGPLTYTYSTIISDLKDSYTAKGKFPGYTWDNHKIKQRIDYILYNKKYKCTNHKIIEKKASDHYAVSAEFKNEG